MAMNSFDKLDLKDLEILTALQENGRISMSRLGQRIGLSQPATSERVRRLEDNGIIEGYTARINSRALGLNMLAIIRLRTVNERIKSCIERFQKIPNIIEVHRVTSDYCFVLKVIVSEPEELEGVVDLIAGFGEISTSVVLRSEPPLAIDQKLIARLNR